MDLVLRAIVVFFLVFLVTRVVGRRELGQLEPFDLILLVVIGDLVQQGVTQSDNSVTGVVIVIGVIAALTMLMSFLEYKLPKLRPILAGEPIVLVEDGQVIERNMRRQRITVEEVAAQARIQQIAALSDVRFAVLETSGDISFIPKTGES
jgi:uncharacterized membrane protein YcaP (DUF421 family)